MVLCDDEVVKCPLGGRTAFVLVLLLFGLINLTLLCSRTKKRGGEKVLTSKGKPSTAQRIGKVERSISVSLGRSTDNEITPGISTIIGESKSNEGDCCPPNSLSTQGVAPVNSEAKKVSTKEAATQSMDSDYKGTKGSSKTREARPLEITQRSSLVQPVNGYQKSLPAAIELQEASKEPSSTFSTVTITPSLSSKAPLRRVATRTKKIGKIGLKKCSIDVTQSQSDSDYHAPTEFPCVRSCRSPTSTVPATGIVAVMPPVIADQYNIDETQLETVTEHYNDELNIRVANNGDLMVS